MLATLKSLNQVNFALVTGAEYRRLLNFRQIVWRAANIERTKKVHFRGNSISSLRYLFYRFRSHIRAGGT